MCTCVTSNANDDDDDDDDDDDNNDITNVRMYVCNWHYDDCVKVGEGDADDDGDDDGGNEDGDNDGDADDGDDDGDDDNGADNGDADDDGDNDGDDDSDDADEDDADGRRWRRRDKFLGWERFMTDRTVKRVRGVEHIDSRDRSIRTYLRTCGL